MKTLLLFFFASISSISFAQPVAEYNSVLDFGVVKADTTNTISFKLKNTGDKPLILMEFISLYPIVTAELPKNPIMPGRTIEIPIVFISKGVRYATKLAGTQFRTNIPNKNIRIVIEFTVK